MRIDVWRQSPLAAALAPEPGEIHLVRCSLDVSNPAAAENARSVLSPAERARAERFHRALDARRYVVSRAVLRALLAGLTGDEPRSIAVARSPLGKPRLPGERSMRFSMSVSGTEALYAFAIDREVGVDVERIDERLFDPASPVLPRGERERLEAIDPPLRLRAFFEAWTRTEAVLKAAGVGIARGDAARLGAGMTIVDCAFDPAYAAALALPGSDFRIRAWALPEGTPLDRAA